MHARTGPRPGGRGGVPHIAARGAREDGLVPTEPAGPGLIGLGPIRTESGADQGKAPIGLRLKNAQGTFGRLIAFNASCRHLVSV